MRGPQPVDPARLGRAATSILGALALTALVVAFLEGSTALPNASAISIVAVVAVAIAFGSVPAVATSIGAFLLYNFLFLEPRFTLTVGDPGELLNLFVLLGVSVVVGRLAAAQRERVEDARTREREARALVAVSRAIAMRTETSDALASLADALRVEAGMDRVWISLGDTTRPDRVLADTGQGPPPVPAVQAHLRRESPDGPPAWVRVHQPVGARAGAAGTAYRVRIEMGDRILGSIWGLRPAGAGKPDPSATRLLAATADQVGRALEQDRLAAHARAAQLARESDALKTALLESVSHDLRTPLASIRAAAGTLADPAVRLPPGEQRSIAEAIDREAEHLARLVTDLLDLGRIESGSLRAERDVYELDELVRGTLLRLRPRLGNRDVVVALPVDLPPVLVDPLFMEQILTNLLDNAARYAPPPAVVRIAASMEADRVRVTVEDGGPGVPEDALPRLFEKFFRVASREDATRRGTGVGLAVVRGLATAMGARVDARPSALGGLAVDVDLVVARLPSELPT